MSSPGVLVGLQRRSCTRHGQSHCDKCQAGRSSLFHAEKGQWLRTANLKVDADVTKNEVTLSSTVDSDAMREKAVELAKTAQVGVVVNNRIKVRQGTTNRTGD
jgi:BON domain